MDLGKIKNFLNEMKDYKGFNTKYPKVWVTKFLFGIIAEFIELIVEMEEYIDSEIKSVRNSMDTMKTKMESDLENAKNDAATALAEQKASSDAANKALQDEINSLKDELENKQDKEGD